jgi:hypothetical protein
MSFRQLVLSQIPVELSIVEFDLADERDPLELFLTYTWEYAGGPGITRDGIGPPHMNFAVGRHTAHPAGLRYGCWLVREEMLDQELLEVQNDLDEANRQHAPGRDIAELQRTVAWLHNTREEIARRNRGEASESYVHAHDAVFASRYPGYEIVAQQGCGDLTMNYWTVAYVNNELVEKPPGGAMVHLLKEPVNDRVYSSLVKWRPSEGGMRRMTIEDTIFDGPEKDVSVRYHDEWIARGRIIEFALSNQQVIRDGAVVPVVTTCRQFSDIRHLLQVPNINPEAPLYPGEPSNENGQYRPRLYYNALRSNDIWLGEEAFIKSAAIENLLRTALSGPVILDFPPNTDERSLRGIMQIAKYHEVRNQLAPLGPGDWRFVSRDDHEHLLEFYLKRNTYGFTMIGLDADGRKMLWLASRGTPTIDGFTIEEAAEQLRAAGAWNALLIDEGFDVMQAVRWDGNLTEMVRRRRQRMRATFIVGRQRHAAHKEGRA